MADVSGLGSLINLAETALEGGGVAADAGGVLGSLGGLGGLLGGASSLDPESFAVDIAGKLLGLNETDMGVIKLAIGAATGDPLAIAGGLAEGISGLSKGESPFAPLESLEDAFSGSSTSTSTSSTSSASDASSSAPAAAAPADAYEFDSGLGD